MDEMCDCTICRRSCRRSGRRQGHYGRNKRRIRWGGCMWKFGRIWWHEWCHREWRRSLFLLVVFVVLPTDVRYVWDRGMQKERSCGLLAPNVLLVLLRTTWRHPLHGSLQRTTKEGRRRSFSHRRSQHQEQTTVQLLSLRRTFSRFWQYCHRVVSKGLLSKQKGEQRCVGAECTGRTKPDVETETTTITQFAVVRSWCGWRWRWRWRWRW